GGGAALKFKAGQYGRAAAHHGAPRRDAPDPGAFDPTTDAGAGSVRAGVRADVAFRLEFPRLSERRVGVQSFRVAAAVRVRRLVRTWRRGAAYAVQPVARDDDYCDRLPRVRVSDLHDLGSSPLRPLRAEVPVRLDVSDRQDQSRRAAFRALSRTCSNYRPLRAARLALAEVTSALPCDTLRPAFTGSFLFRCISQLCRALRDDRGIQRRGHADRAQYRGDHHNGCRGGPDIMVQRCRRTTSGSACGAATGRNPRGRRGSMRWLVPALVGIITYGTGAIGAEDNVCLTAASLVHADFPLSHVAAAIKNKHLDIVVVGSTSSMLPSPGGPAKAAYPTKLEAVLASRLKGVTVKVTSYARPRQTAAEMEKDFGRILMDAKPALVIWQTGTFEAIRGIDLDEFRSTLDEGVETLHTGNADVVLMNMQYSPRTETMISAAGYA